MHSSTAPRSTTLTLAPSPWLRPLAVLVALALSFLISARGADAELKSEWKFGGTLTRAIMSLPVAGSVLGDAGGYAGLPSVVQPTYPGGSLGDLFSRPGLVGGFAAGFLGSGVLGLLFGHGVVGELTGIAAALGLIFQLALIAMLARLIWTWWRDDRVDAFDVSPRRLADAYGRARNGALPNIDADESDAALGAGEGDPLPATEHLRS
jgi:hypothetical protein